MVCGDFNDHGNADFWDEGFCPFTNLIGTNDILRLTKVKSQHKPPFTCCIGRNHLRGTPPWPNVGEADDKYGDYILVNDRLDSKLKIPDNSTFEQDARIHPTSDHLPIIRHFYKNNIIPKWIFSENTIITTYGGKQLILVFSKDAWLDIGYIDPKYLRSTNTQYEYALNRSITLRKRVTDDDPNQVLYIKGASLA